MKSGWGAVRRRRCRGSWDWEMNRGRVEDPEEDGEELMLEDCLKD
jgi:hypothetical protein